MTPCCLENCHGSNLSEICNSVLTEEEVMEIEASRIEVTYRKGENICKQGTRATSILCIQSGLVSMYREEDSVYYTLLLKKRGDLIGLQSLYSNNIYPYSAEALSQTKACFIEISVFEKLFAENAAFAARLIQYINQEIILMFEKLYSFSIKHLHGRLAEFLLYLQKHIYHSNPFELTLSKTTLSEILGTSKESISRLFKEFKDDHIIKESGHQIEILDFPRLKRISTTG